MTPMKAIEELRKSLATIAIVDPSYTASTPMYHSYDIRNREIQHALWLAMCAGYNVGVKRGRKGWPIAYITLPTGQVSWHLPEFPIDFDGHSTDEKYERIKRYLEGHTS